MKSNPSLPSLAASLVICLAMLTPSISLGQTATPGKVAPPRHVRTLPSSPENARIIIDAYRVALATPSVRRIALDEIRKQLRKNGPMLFIDGYWIVPIEMSIVYRNPSVRSALKTAIASGNGKPGKLTQNLSNLELSTKLTTDVGLSTAESALGLATLPMWRAPAMHMDAEIGKFLASIGTAQDALQQSITDFFGIDDVIVVGLVLLGAAAVGYVISEDQSGTLEPFPYSDSGDVDHDGKNNFVDDDDDNDGVKDKDDYYPLDNTRHICDCGNLGGPHSRIIGFTSQFSLEFTNQAINMLNQVKLQSASANTIPLGLAASGNVANNLQIRALFLTGTP